MSVSVSMPQLGESVTEGTVTRWLKKEGERVEADEPLLEVSTDKVDTEIPSPVSGILRGITVAEDETVAVGAELAVIDESADGAGAAPTAEAAPAQAPPAEAPPAEAPPAEAPPAEAPAAQAPPAQAPPAQAPPAQAPPAEAPPAEAPPAEAPAAQAQPAEAAPEYPQAPAAQEYPQAPAAPEYAPGAEPGYEPADQPAAYAPPAEQAAPPAAPQAEQAAPPAPAAEQAPAAAPAAEQAPPAAPAAEQAPPAAPEADGSRPADVAPPAPAADATAPAAPAPPSAPPAAEPASAAPVLPSAGDGPYVTPLVRKLAAEHGVDLGAVPGTGVGGRIRKQDVLEAARAAREGAPAAAAAAPAATTPAATTPAATTAAPPAPPATTPAAAAPAAPATAPARDIVPSTLRGTTERMSRARQLIARRMVESLQTSAQLTTVAEADVTLIARLRDRAKADFEAREGVKLSFLPFFALATVEALKIHPKLNAVIDTEAGQVTYHDAEHLGIAVDTERGLMVPVIQNAGDLNIGGLARKIADLAARTRAGQVSPDDLSGGTFTLTNTGSRGALFDTPIINQPQVAILGTGSVVKRPVVVEDPQLGEVITVRSMVYLALTYDHRLVDGADAARFLATVKDRLEEGEFEAELGL
jgi:pyruvate dehydrogenase E2 component (dihydrolipoamide acetyltransferase)